MSVTQNGTACGNVSTDHDVKRNGSDVTANVRDSTINCTDSDVKRNGSNVTQSGSYSGNIAGTQDVKRYGDRAIRRSESFVVELYLFSLRSVQVETPWQERIEKAWSQTVNVTIENFETEYREAWDEQRRQWRNLGISSVSAGMAVDGEITSTYKKIVPCWECGDLVLLDMFDNRLGQYCSDQCRDDRYRREQAESKRRQRAELRGERCCDHCGETYKPKRSGSKFCSTRCRVAASRAAKIGGGE